MLYVKCKDIYSKMYIYVCVCVCIYIHTYIYIYIYIKQHLFYLPPPFYCTCMSPCRYEWVCWDPGGWWMQEQKAHLDSHSVWSFNYHIFVYRPPRGDYQEKHLLPLLTLKYSDTAWALALAFPHLSDKGVEGETPRSVNIIKSFVQQAQGWLVSGRSWFFHSKLK